MRTLSTSAVRPVSRKAYSGFVARIHSVLGDTPRATALVKALDRYLGGESDAVDGLDDASAMAFAFLRQDVDAAIERSRRARERAAKRKASAAAPSADAESGKDDAVFVPPMTRRERRALARERGVRSTRWDHLNKRPGLPRGSECHSGVLSRTERSARREETRISVDV